MAVYRNKGTSSFLYKNAQGLFLHVLVVPLNNGGHVGAYKWSRHMCDASLFRHSNMGTIRNKFYSIKWLRENPVNDITEVVGYA